MTLYELLLSEIDHSSAMLMATDNPVRQDYWKKRIDLAEELKNKLTIKQAKFVWYKIF